MNARFFLAGVDLEARFFLAGDVEAGPDEAGLLDDSPPPLPLQLLLPLPCHCSVAEVEGGATLIEGGGTALDVATDVGSWSSKPCLACVRATRSGCRVKPAGETRAGFRRFPGCCARNVSPPTVPCYLLSK